MRMDKWSTKEFSKMEFMLMDMVTFYRKWAQILIIFDKFIGILYHDNGNENYKGIFKNGVYDGEG